MSWQPWAFSEPFIAYTPILAEEMNPKLNGISASFTYVADELNNFIPRLPSNFTGQVVIPNGGYTNTLLGIDEVGNVALIDQISFLSGRDKAFSIVKAPNQQTVVNGNNHGDWLMMEYSDDTNGIIEVIVGPAIADIDGVSSESVAATIVLTQDSANSLVLTPADGVTIKSPGHLTAYGQNSTVTLIAVDQYTWVMGGDVRPTDLII